MQCAPNINAYEKESASVSPINPIFVETCQFSKKKCASVSQTFTNFIWNLPVFKKGVRLNFTNFRRKLSIFKKGVRCNFTNFRQKLSILKKGVRGVGRAVSVGRRFAFSTPSWTTRSRFARANTFNSKAFESEISNSAFYRRSSCEIKLFFETQGKPLYLQVKEPESARIMFFASAHKLLP